MSDVKLTVDQQAPADNGAVTTPNTGAWPVSTTSLKVMARYADDATDIDNFGVDRTTVAAWDNITTANNDAIVVPVTVDTRRAFTFEVVYQSLSAYDESLTGALVDAVEVSAVQTSVNEWTVTINDNTTSVNLEINEAANDLEFSPPSTPGVVYRDKNGRAYQGDLITKSFLDSRSIEQMVITANSILGTDTTGKITMQRWKKNNVYLKLEFPDFTASSFYVDLHGMIKDLSYYNQRSDDEDIQIIMDIDAETTT